MKYDIERFENITKNIEILNNTWMIDVDYKATFLLYKYVIFVGFVCTNRSYLYEAHKTKLKKRNSFRGKCLS